MRLTHILTTALLSLPLALQAQKQLTTDEFEKQLAKSGDAQLLDVRTPDEYGEGHLAKAANVDYKSPDFNTKIAKLDKNKPVYVYCLSGGRSAAAAAALHEHGFKEVYDMKGGYLKWNTSGKAVEGANKAGVKGMSSTEFNKIINSEKVVLVDIHAKWCPPCVKMLPTVTKLQKEYAGKARIETIAYDPNKTLVKELGVEEIPAFLLYKNGKLIARKNGFMEEKEFRALLDAQL
ncbi:MAG: thioredoxin fold domain-containing protein [Dyadobacter sp.]|uniref:rhodanese-like domain-containing protein n=1 Tax=Dyadobacter sp. TaxID=1914288 RepID=UPI001AFDA22B|nr:rhodanese-like domain-containing protein [Dyadobacter sp.]MBO9615313.1 thioredoxin fold domain-containing protein [Dyadobacter sp.]